MPAVGTNTCTKQEQYGTEREGYDTTMSLNVPARDTVPCAACNHPFMPVNLDCHAVCLVTVRMLC